jgi:hypothetical protein
MSTARTADATRARSDGTERTQRNYAVRTWTETKSAFKTTEFVAFVAVVAGILIAGLATKAGIHHRDVLPASQAWLYVVIVTAGYMISRGLAKSGSREPYIEDH